MSEQPGGRALSVGRATLLVEVLWWPFLLAFIAFLRGPAVIGPVRTAIVSTVEPFWGGLLASVVLAQPLVARTLTGGLSVAAAIVLLNLPQRADRPVLA